jgi:hypothetical protein
MLPHYSPSDIMDVPLQLPHTYVNNQTPRITPSQFYGLIKIIQEWIIERQLTMGVITKLFIIRNCSISIYQAVEVLRVIYTYYIPNRYSWYWKYVILAWVFGYNVSYRNPPILYGNTEIIMLVKTKLDTYALEFNADETDTHITGKKRKFNDTLS